MFSVRILAQTGKSTFGRVLFSTCAARNKYNEPLSGHDMVRAGGIASMMRLPVQSDTTGLDACFVGVPLDIGTSNRSGTRYGPRQIRCESALLRKVNSATGASPYDCMQVADIGDVNLNLYNLPKACEDIRRRFSDIVKDGCIPLALGGDHTMSYPILQAIKEKHGAVGLVHIDAHSDTHDLMLGEKIAHGTPFRRAMEEGCLVGNKVIQIGLRGSIYDTGDYDWAREQGFRCIQAHECWHKSLEPLMVEVREMMGNHPVYLSFDIDGLDPCFAPGTGTPEIGGLTSIQGLEIVRGCKGLNVVGGDLVEVSPPYDVQGTTALTGANLLFEMLCILQKVK
ncbi:hypothetical protein ACF0H5_020949 [Mactra antiquata]